MFVIAVCVVIHVKMIKTGSAKSNDFHVFVSLQQTNDLVSSNKLALHRSFAKQSKIYMTKQGNKNKKSLNSNRMNCHFCVTGTILSSNQALKILISSLTLRFAWI